LATERQNPGYIVVEIDANWTARGKGIGYSCTLKRYVLRISLNTIDGQLGPVMFDEVWRHDGPSFLTIHPETQEGMTVLTGNANAWMFSDRDSPHHGEPRANLPAYTMAWYLTYVKDSDGTINCCQLHYVEFWISVHGNAPNGLLLQPRANGPR
jgi:hypothetical protein